MNTNEHCQHGVPYCYDCEYCREGIEPYNCKHGIDHLMGCLDCAKEKKHMDVSPFEDRTVTIQLLKFNEPDANGDVFMPGCIRLFKSGKSIFITRENSIQMRDVIGKVMGIRQDNDKAEIVLSSEHANMRDTAFTFGYIVNKSRKENGLTIIDEMELCIVSPTPFRILPPSPPAQPDNTDC